MDPLKDAAEHRDEFEMRLHRILMDKQLPLKYLEALMDGDEEIQALCVRERQTRNAEVAKYLQDYDNCSSKEERQRVVASVKPLSP